MSFASWYHHHYATWNRTRRLQQSPYIARTDTNVSRAAAALHSGTANPGDMSNNAKDKKVQESLFGPNIGVVSSGPAWAAATEKKVLTDELTPDIVNSWIEKSKDTSQPTTTLQALVNLKRPTIRLSPLAEEPGNGSDVQHHHGLEFEYDCDAPKCGIYVHVLLPKDHPDAPVTSTTSSLSKLLIFEMVVEGGFGKTLKLEDGALLDLGRFEHSSAGNPAPKDTSAANIPSPPVINTEPPSTSDLQEPPAPSETATPASVRARRRFTHFAFRRRSQHPRNVTGPALAVVDAEPAPTTNDTKEKDDNKEGVRVIIRLAALDEQGTELASPNEQVTYLHVVRFGEELEEDARPWVVKVVKREATIGPHTFHLHEIFGLSSSSTSATHPAPMSALPSPPESESHTYPPTPSAIVPPVATEEDPSSECLLCLSSPREVVLLPCRHLVACKDCALNMVEFGAGGNIIQPTQAEEPAAADMTETAADGAANGTGTAPTGVPISPISPTNTRRKRKAKGWFCPVCRQPYTSLLRITTNPPPPMPDGDKEASGAGDAEGSTSPAHGSEARTGIFGTSLLRGLSFNRNHAADVENQAGTGRVGA